MTIINLKSCWLINNRYQIFKNNGVIYDTLQAKDIPQDIFSLRDKLIKTEHDQESIDIINEYEGGNIK